MSDNDFLCCWPEKQGPVTEADRALYWGLCKMDTGLTRHSPNMIKLIKHLIRHHMLDGKTPDRLRKNNDGSSVRLVTSKLTYRPSSDATKSILNLIFAVASEAVGHRAHDRHVRQDHDHTDGHLEPEGRLVVGISQHLGVVQHHHERQRVHA